MKRSATMPEAKRLANVVTDFIAGLNNPDRDAKALWLSHADALDSFQEDILDVCYKLAAAGKDALRWNLAPEFLSHLCKAIPEQLSDECTECIEHVLGKMCEITYASDVLIRQRVLIIIHYLLAGMEEAKLGITDDLADLLVEKLKERLDDRAATVRRAAVQALSNLTLVNEEGHLDEDDEVVELLQARLSVEPHKVVRATIMTVMMLDVATQDCFVERSRDMDPEVRAVVFQRLASQQCDVFTLETRMQLLQSGLGDRVSTVQEAALGMCRKWLEGCGGDVHVLLDLLGVSQHPGGAALASLVLKSLLTSQEPVLDVAQLLNNTPGGSMRPGPHDPIMSPAVAYTRRYACLALHDRASERGRAAAATRGAAASVVAADATQAYDMLDVALPESPEAMVQLLERVVDAGPQHRFTAMQLLQVATVCMDWADAHSRAAGQQLLTTKLLPLDPRFEEDVCVLAGCGGSGEWEEVVARFSACLTPMGPEYLEEVLGGVRQAMDAWGMTPASQGVDPAPCCWLQCLATTQQAVLAAAGAATALLEATPSSPAGGHWLLTDLLWPALKHTEAKIRSAAIRVLGLLALLPSRACILPGVCQAARRMMQTDSDLAAKAQAILTLCDIMMVVGVRSAEWEAWAAPAVAQGGAREGGGEGDVDVLADQLAGTQLDGGGDARDLIGCMVDILQQHMVAKKAKATRGKSKASAGSQPDQQALSPEVVMAVVQGATRLLVYQDTHSKLAKLRGCHDLGLTAAQAQALLRQLLCCHVHPAMAAAPEAQQCLALFLQKYSSMAMYRPALASALAPAARQALSISLGAKKTAAPQLVKSVAYLLLTPPPPADPSQSQGGDDGAAQQGVGEAGAGLLSWEEEVVVGCVVLVGGVMRAQEAVEGADELAKELAALVLSIPLDAQQHPRTIKACDQQAQQLHAARLQRKSKVPVALSRVLQKMCEHLGVLGEEVGAADVTQAEVDEIIARAAEATSQAINHYGGVKPGAAGAPAPAVLVPVGEEEEDDGHSDDQDE